MLIFFFLQTPTYKRHLARNDAVITVLDSTNSDNDPAAEEEESTYGPPPLKKSHPVSSEESDNWSDRLTLETIIKK